MRLSALLLALLLFCTACTPGIQMPFGPAGTEAIDLTPAPPEPQETPAPTETPMPTASPGRFTRSASARLTCVLPLPQRTAETSSANFYMRKPHTTSAQRANSAACSLWTAQRHIVTQNTSCRKKRCFMPMSRLKSGKKSTSRPDFLHMRQMALRPSWSKMSWWISSCTCRMRSTAR